MRGNFEYEFRDRFPHYVLHEQSGSGHSMECDVFFSMEVKAAISWKCYVFNSMEFHDIAGLTFEKCTPADSMEKFQTTVGLTLGGV